jgi:hypothetical protein
MATDDSDPETLHPTNLRVAATFLDILFGVLLGIIVLEFPIEEMLPAKGVWAYLFLFVLYFGLFAKFFFYWCGVHHDIAVFSEIEGYRAKLGHYFSGLFMAFSYFACVRLLVVWFKHWPRDDWPFVSLLIAVSVLKVIEFPANLVFIPRMARSAIPEASQELPRMQTIIDWYRKGQPIRAWRFILPVFVLIPSIWRGPCFRWTAILLYLILEFWTEADLFVARKRMWSELTKGRPARHRPPM